jgi:hypothetical protein
MRLFGGAAIDEVITSAAFAFARRSALDRGSNGLSIDDID